MPLRQFLSLFRRSRAILSAGGLWSLRRRIPGRRPLSGHPSRKTRWVATAHALVRFGGVPVGWTEIHRAGSGAEQRAVHAVRLMPGARRIAIKSFVDPERASADYRHQAESARRHPGALAPLYRSRIGRHVAAPYLAGGTLVDRLAERPATRIMAAPAAWLRDLHARSPDGLPRVTLRAEFDALLARPTIAGRPALARAAAAWREVAGDGSTDVAVPLHGDFHPANIAFDEERRLRILDFGPATAGPAILDLGQYLAHLQLRLVLDTNAAGARWPLWRDATLEHYGRPELAHSPALAAAMQMRRLHMLLFTFTRPPGGPRKRREAFLWRQATRSTARPEEALRL